MQTLKLFLKITFLFSTSLYIVTTYTDSPTPEVQILKNITFKYQIPIAQADIIGGQTFIIDQPGDYYLASNLLFKTQQNESIIILIKTDNVTLNLNNKTISTENHYHDTKAIQIDSSLSNIIIQNGTINKINGQGIFIDKNCSNLAIRNILISHSCCSGLSMKNAQDCIVDNIYISQCINHQAERQPIGISLLNCTNCTINRSFFNSFTNLLGNSYGILLENCQGCDIFNCKVSSLEGKSVYGIYLKNTSACLLKNNKSILNKATEGSSCGYCFTESRNNTIYKCEAQTNNSKTGNVYGFYFDNVTSHRIESCISRDNYTSNQSYTYGFLANQSIGLGFIKCNAFANLSDNIAVGFGIENNTRGTSIHRCIAISNNGKNEAYGVKLGSEKSHVSQNVVMECQIISNIGYCKQYGIKDFDSNSSTCLLHNMVIGHGQIFTGSPELIDNGKMNYMVRYKSEEKRPDQIIVEGDTSFLQNLPQNQYLNISLGTD